MEASYEGHAATARLFLEAGANMETEDEVWLIVSVYSWCSCNFLMRGNKIKSCNTLGFLILRIPVLLPQLLLTSAVFLEYFYTLASPIFSSYVYAFCVIQNDGSTAFLRAAMFGDVATMTVLLEAGADIDAKDAVGLSCA